MKKIKNNELKNIYGGGFNFGIVALIGAGLTFLIGLVDGLNRLKWQKRKSTVFKGNSRGKPLIQIQQKDVIMFIKLLDLRLI